jgi:hypothetical protein
MGRETPQRRIEAQGELMDTIVHSLQDLHEACPDGEGEAWMHPDQFEQMFGRRPNVGSGFHGSLDGRIELWTSPDWQGPPRFVTESLLERLPECIQLHRGAFLREAVLRRGLRLRLPEIIERHRSCFEKLA